MKRQTPAENTALVIALAIAFFGALAALGWRAGVFAKLDADELAVLAGFVAGFAALTYGVDRQVRATIGRAASVLRRFLNKPVASATEPLIESLGSSSRGPVPHPRKIGEAQGIGEVVSPSPRSR